MINTAILIFLSLLNAINADLIATTQTGVLVPGNAYMEMRDYILNLQVIHGGYGTISGGINITINNQEGGGDSFDVFMLNDVSQMACYKSMVLSNNYDNSTCMFTSYLLEQTSFNLTFEYSNFQQYNNTPYQYFVIDNTPYKQTLTNGTMKNIYLNIKYTAYIQPSTYYFTIILLLSIFFCIVLVGASLTLHRKWRNYKNEHAEYEENKREVKSYRKNAVSQAANFTEATKDLLLSPYSPVKDRMTDSVISRSSKGKSIISTQKMFPN